MRTTLRLLQGETMEFVEEVQRLYGITPVWTDETHFEAAHQVLDDLLPGDGPLADRLQSFREQVQVSAERAASLIERLAADLGARTRQRFDLPAGRGCTFEFVTDQPWTAYNWYLGESLPGSTSTWTCPSGRMGYLSWSATRPIPGTTRNTASRNTGTIERQDC